MPNRGFVPILPECEIASDGADVAVSEAKARGAVEVVDPESLSFKLWHLWMSAAIGPLRLPHALYNTFALPGGAGTNTAIRVAVNNGTMVKFVRLTNPAGGGAPTFLGGSAGVMSLESSAVVNMGVAPFFDAILYPGESLWAQNQAGVAYRLTVAAVDVPFRQNVW